MFYRNVFKTYLLAAAGFVSIFGSSQAVVLRTEVNYGSMSLPANKDLESLWLGQHPYMMKHINNTDSYGCRFYPDNVVQVQFDIESQYFFKQNNPAAHWAATLRNNTDIYSGWQPVPEGSARLSVGNGIAVGSWGDGSPDFPPGSPVHYGPVVEYFNKDLKILEPTTLTQLTPAQISSKQRYYVSSLRDSNWAAKGWASPNAVAYAVNAMVNGQFQQIGPIQLSYDPNNPDIANGDDITFAAAFYEPGFSQNIWPYAPINFSNIIIRWSC